MLSHEGAKKSEYIQHSACLYHARAVEMIQDTVHQDIRSTAKAQLTYEVISNPE